MLWSTLVGKAPEHSKHSGYMNSSSRHTTHTANTHINTHLHTHAKLHWESGSRSGNSESWALLCHSELKSLWHWVTTGLPVCSFVCLHVWARTSSIYCPGCVFKDVRGFYFVCVCTLILLLPFTRKMCLGIAYNIYDTHMFSACMHIYIRISRKRKPLLWEQCETVHTVSCAAEVLGVAMFIWREENLTCTLRHETVAQTRVWWAASLWDHGCRQACNK